MQSEQSKKFISIIVKVMLVVGLILYFLHK